MGGRSFFPPILFIGALRTQPLHPHEDPPFFFFLPLLPPSQSLCLTIQLAYGWFVYFHTATHVWYRSCTGPSYSGSTTASKSVSPGSIPGGSAHGGKAAPSVSEGGMIEICVSAFLCWYSCLQYVRLCYQLSCMRREYLFSVLLFLRQIMRVLRAGICSLLLSTELSVSSSRSLSSSLRL